MYHPWRSRRSSAEGVARDKDPDSRGLFPICSVTIVVVLLTATRLPLEPLSEAGLHFLLLWPASLSLLRESRGNHHAQNEIITAGIPTPRPTPRAMLFDWLSFELGGVDGLLSVVGVIVLDVLFGLDGVDVLLSVLVVVVLDVVVKASAVVFLVAVIPI